MNTTSVPCLPLRHALIPLLAVVFSSPLAGQFCGNNEPAFPVPECRDQTNGNEVACSNANAVRLWSDNLRPGQPGQQIPAQRDSTQWRSFTIPGFATGHELFQSLDIVNDHLYVVYNAGHQVWNIAGSNAEDPERRFVRDGWRGDYLEFPLAGGENDFFTEDIDGIDPTTDGNQDVLVAVAGEQGVGVSIWEHTLSPERFDQLYQDFTNRSQQVRTVEFNGNVYVFATGANGVFVYHASRARTLASPCLDRGGTVCPGIFLGEIDELDFAQTIDVFERGNRLYVAAGGGGGSSFQIWEVDPASASAVGLRFSGLDNGVWTPVLFPYAGHFYVALLERVGTNRVIRIFNVDSCLDTNGCSSLGSSLFSFTVSSVGSKRFLTFSTSNGTPFLYYGVQSNNLSSTKIERLFNLQNLGDTNQITEITDGGGTYTDDCTGNTVDYWGDYYADNGHGLRNIRPRVGKFDGNFFYRAAFGILDVHVANLGPGVPVITTTVDDPPPHCMNRPIDFSATAENCDGAESWTWNDDDTVASTINANGSSASITFGLCNGSDCPQRQVEVWALKDACAGNPALIEDRAMVTVVEPRPHIRAIDVCPQSDPGCAQVPEPEFPVCTVLRFTADVDGCPGFGYLWQVRDAVGAVVATGTQPVFDWDTSGVELELMEEIFADGFESGNTRAWSETSGVSQPRSPEVQQPKRLSTASLRQLLEKGGGASATFDVELTLTNADGNDLGTRSITLNGLGALGFGAPPITATDQGDGLFAFQANTENATEWRWEIEDPGNGSTAGCLFYDTCQIVDWGQDDGQITYVWQPPNVPGTYGVTVSIRNCVVENPLSAEVLVNVTEIVNPEPPVVTSFRVNDNDCSCALGFCECPRSQPITFAVTSTGDPDTYEFDWEGDGTFDGTMIPVGSTITHIFTSPGSFDPRVRAHGGAEVSDPVTCQDTVIIE